MNNSREKFTCIRYKVSFIVVLTTAVFFNYIVVSAVESSTYKLGSGTSVYKYDELLKNYQTSGITYNRNMVFYKIKQYDGELAAESYQAVNSQYSNSVEELAQLNSTKDSYLEIRETITDPDELVEIDTQIDNINAQLQQYNSSVNALKSNVADAKLQEQINKFYSQNEYIIKQEAMTKLNNDFLKQCYSLMLYQEKKEYYEAHQEYLKTAKKVEEIKYDLGISDYHSLKIAETNLLKNKMSIENNQASFDSVYNKIKADVNQKDNFKIVLPLTVNRKEYNYDRIQFTFERNNSSLVQMKYMAQCYDNYLYSNNGSDALREQILLRISEYQLQYDELKISMKTYINNAISAYGQAFDSMETAEKDLQIAMRDYEAVIAKRANKRATDLDVCKAKYDVEAAQVSYYQSLYNVKVWQDILDHGIYGASPQ